MAGQKTDYIIVGGGLAGISLALELALRGKMLVLLDKPEATSSSRVAAGIIHPIVPKGVRLTWMGETLFPLIADYYRGWENKLNASFYQPLNGFQIHPNQETANFWQLRSQTAEMQPWIDSLNQTILPGISADHAHTPILHCARLDTSAFLLAAEEWFKTRIVIEHTEFQHASLRKEKNQWRYGVHTADGVIFCEGIRVLENPWFNKLHFHPTAGDILTLAFDENLPQALYKNRSWLVPDGKGNWMAGSTFHKGSLETSPLPEDAAKLMEQIRSWTRIPFRLLKHKRGVRPTVDGRRPYLGEHSRDRGIFIYNGLGSKGGSLIPWLSPMMADFLCKGKALHTEVDITRFDL
ncbi:MAG: FAD-binding oxidoreductase [Bacteroidetes bacterium]|nr:FAD-binding oxidoreductase [Bacteroidota bacterium]